MAFWMSLHIAYLLLKFLCIAPPIISRTSSHVLSTSILPNICKVIPTNTHILFVINHTNLFWITLLKLQARLKSIVLTTIITNNNLKIKITLLGEVTIDGLFH